MYPYTIRDGVLEGYGHCRSGLTVQGLGSAHFRGESDDATTFFSLDGYFRIFSKSAMETLIGGTGLSNVGIGSAPYSFISFFNSTGSQTMFNSAPNVGKLGGLVLQSAAIHQVRSKTVGHWDGES